MSISKDTRRRAKCYKETVETRVKRDGTRLLLQPFFVKLAMVYLTTDKAIYLTNTSMWGEFVQN